MFWNSLRAHAHRNAFRAFLLGSLALAIALAFAPASNATIYPKGTPLPKACSLDASPSHAVRLINTPHAITVTVLKERKVGRKKKCDVPMVGASLSVRVLTGPNAGSTASLLTDANGKAVYNTTSAQTGIEIIKFWGVGRLDVTRTFWITSGGGPGPYGEKHKGVHFHAAGSNSGAMYVPTRCVTRDFRIHPAFYGGTFSASSLKIDGREVDTSDSDADSYSVRVKRLRKGRTHTITVTGEFATGNDVVLTAKVKRCGR